MRLLVILLFGITLSGCSALMMGGGSTGGSPAQKDRPANSSQGTDSAITDRVRNRHAADPIVSKFALGVSTSGGMVTLSGTVASFGVRETAEKLAMATDGVRAVDNQITVK